MSAPDFYFGVNAIFRYLHDRCGKAALVAYWRELGREHYRARWESWRVGGAEAIAADWRNYFSHEPGADVEARLDGDAAVLDVRICPAIRHLRADGRDIVPYFCDHCDHVSGAMAEAAGFVFRREGGGGACVQRFVSLTHEGEGGV